MKQLHVFGIVAIAIMTMTMLTGCQEDDIIVADNNFQSCKIEESSDVSSMTAAAWHYQNWTTTLYLSGNKEKIFTLVPGKRTSVFIANGGPCTISCVDEYAAGSSSGTFQATVAGERTFEDYDVTFSGNKMKIVVKSHCLSATPLTVSVGQLYG